MIPDSSRTLFLLIPPVFGPTSEQARWQSRAKSRSRLGQVLDPHSSLQLRGTSASDIEGDAADHAAGAAGEIRPAL